MVSSLDSPTKALGSIPFGVMSTVSLSDLLNPQSFIRESDCSIVLSFGGDVKAVGFMCMESNTLCTLKISLHKNILATYSQPTKTTSLSEAAHNPQKML